MLRALLGAKSARLFLLLSAILNFILLYQDFYRNSSVTKQGTLMELPQISPVSGHLKKNLPGLDKNQGLRHQSLKNQQLIFVGGVPRSGTTLVRAMLDAHPDIRCGEETRVIPRILSMRGRWSRSAKERSRLEQAKMHPDLLDEATRAFIDTVILGHGAMAPFLCNKDPLVMNYLLQVDRLYPRSKFVLLIRDGRAVAYSIVSRNVTISGVNTRSYLSAAMFWNKAMLQMSRDCDYVGPTRCMEVFYEKLVEEPKVWMEKLLQFLGIPWHDNVLHHHELINKEISLSK